MKTESIHQLEFAFYRGNRKKAEDLVVEKTEVFEKICSAIEDAKNDLVKKKIEDPEAYMSKKLEAHMLNELIKKHINKIEIDSHRIIKIEKYGSLRYVVDGELSLYVKKLNKKGLPSYNPTKASKKRMNNMEDIPCAFIGPRVNEMGMIGDTFISITYSSNGIPLNMRLSFEKINEVNIGLMSSEATEVNLKVKETKKKERSLDMQIKKKA